MSSSPITLSCTNPTSPVAAPRAVTEHGGLLDALATVPDPRARRGVRYRLANLLAVAVCAVAAGAVTFAAIADYATDLDPEHRHRLGLTGPVPAATTWWRLLTRLDPVVVQTALTRWLRARVSPPVRVPRDRTLIAVDGKALRGSRRPDGSMTHLLSAYDTGSGLVLAQVPIAAKSNEIPAFTPLLDQLQQILGDLTGIVFVADALHTQVEHAHQVTNRGAHLLVPVKANQPRLHQLLRTLPWARIRVGHRTREHGHSRTETRTVKAVTVQLPGGLGFPHAAQAVRITRTRTIAGRTRREYAYLIITLPAAQAQPDQLAHWIRSHWHIENRLHWIRDMTLAEDLHRARTGNGPAIAAVLRNTAIGYHRTTGQANIARAIRRAARHPEELINNITHSHPTTQ
jgi:predicted transposase YbfD/YdcC